LFGITKTLQKKKIDEKEQRWGPSNLDDKGSWACEEKEREQIRRKAQCCPSVKLCGGQAEPNRTDLGRKKLAIRATDVMPMNNCLRKGWE